MNFFLDYFSKSFRDTENNLSIKKTYFKSENNLYHNALEAAKDLETSIFNKDKEDERCSKISKYTTIKRRQSILLQSKILNNANKSIKENTSNINLTSNSTFHPSNSINNKINTNITSNGNSQNQGNLIINPNNQNNKEFNINAINSIKESNSKIKDNQLDNFTYVSHPHQNGILENKNKIEKMHHTHIIHNLNNKSNKSLNKVNCNINQEATYIANNYNNNVVSCNGNSNNKENYLQNFPTKEFVNNESFENEIQNNIEYDLTTNKKIFEENFLESNNIKIAQVPCCPNVNMKCKYSDIGLMRMNFYDILQEKEDFIRKRTSRVFRSFSLHYANNNEMRNSDLNLIVNNNNNLSCSPKKGPFNYSNEFSKDNQSNNSPNLNIKSNNNINNSPNKNSNNNNNNNNINNAF